MDDKKKSVETLNRLKIPLPELRIIIVDWMKEGFTEIPLGEFLTVLSTIAQKSKTDSEH